MKEGMKKEGKPGENQGKEGAKRPWEKERKPRRNKGTRENQGEGGENDTKGKKGT